MTINNEIISRYNNKADKIKYLIKSDRERKKEFTKSSKLSLRIDMK